jgi:MoxR-like ATPase
MGSAVFTPCPISMFFEAMVTVPSGAISTKAVSAAGAAPGVAAAEAGRTPSSRPPAAVAATVRNSRRSKSVTLAMGSSVPYGAAPPEDSSENRNAAAALAARPRPGYRYGMNALPDPIGDRPRSAAVAPPPGFTGESRLAADVLDELGRVIVGQRTLLERLLIGLLADGHVLLEGVPGLAKTLAVRTLAATVSGGFHRIQFTPDLLPADLIGTQIYNQRSGEFTVQKGPIFTNILLADEINRAPAKVQSALLEAMQEKQVTIGGQTFPLPELFLVLATQNPIEHEGTYPLPEAQVDRFMFKLVVTYPRRGEERQVLDRMTSGPEPEARHVLDPARVLHERRLVREIYVDARVKEYVLDVLGATRDPAAVGLGDLRPLIEYGASPRAGIFLLRAAKAHAFLAGRDYVTPEDVKQLALDTLRHRVVLSYRADADGVGPDALLERLLAAVPVP